MNRRYEMADKQDRCGKCKYAVTKKYGTNVHCRLTGNGQKGISSKACERFERREDNG